MHGQYGITRESKVPIHRLAHLLRKAVEEKFIGQAYEIWKMAYPLMMTKIIPYVGFDDLRQKLTVKKSTQITGDDIEKEMADMIEISRKRGD